MAATVDLDAWSDISEGTAPCYRWKDVAANSYALSYQYTYTYDDASVTVSFDDIQWGNFSAHLTASNLKPNFAYQVKLEGKPTSLWGADGDDVSNELLGYAGRWWRVQPNPGNASDSDYEAHHDDPAYIYVGYLCFDFFVTDQFGNMDLVLRTDSSYHVLWWEHQRTPQACDSPVSWRTVVGDADDDAYDEDVGPTTIGVYAEIERGCEGTTTLANNAYHCRFILTEESFHQSGPPDQRWVDVSGNRFWMDGGPFYYAGTNNYYLMVYAADPAKRPYVDEVLTDAKAMNLNVVRTWAFSDGEDESVALQLQPGVYDETVFQGLDYVLAKAKELDLHLILPMVNNWNDYGGMNQYVEWGNGTPPPPPGSDFVTVNGRHFEIGGERFYLSGANFWSAMNLASTGVGGDRARLDREMAHLQALGVTSVTIMVGSEGPNTEPWRIVPALQTEPGVYDPAVLDGLDYLLKSLGDHGILGIFCLSNFWPWSGGLAQYVSWNGGGEIPYPPPEPGGDWNVYAHYTDDFYSNAGAKQDYRDFVTFLLNRVNPYTGVAYMDDPWILAWELANEPRGYENATAFNLWIDETAAYIKSIDANHLVTNGCEGDTPWPAWNGLDFSQNSDGPDIDFATIHIWPQNWLWYDPENPEGTFNTAVTNAVNYFNTHESEANTLNKPLLLQEFGLARDGGSYDPAAATTWRDTFYAAMCDEVYASMVGNGPCVGGMFWAWAGEGRPLEPYGSLWSPGDPWIGDPPHESQGWYSVYDSDTNTLSVISSHAADVQALMSGSALIHDDFYTDANCKQWYKDHVAAVLNRVNTVNGMTYKNDPTVMAWELANEPRCSSDPTGATLQAWIAEMSAYIKSLDPRHLVTTGSEGFYGPSGPAHNPGGGWWGIQGVDFIPNHQVADVDFATFHLYMENYGMTYAQTLSWIGNHIDDGEALLGKPVVLEEFGRYRPLDGAQGRDACFQAWYDLLYDKASAGLAAGGSNFWILYHDAYPDYDHFGVYYPGDASTTAIIAAEALAFRLLSDPAAGEGNWACAMVQDDLSFSLGTGDDIIPPGAVGDLQATPGHEEITVSWTSPGDPDIVAFEVFRGLWHDGSGGSAYPEYDDDEGNVVPVRPGNRAQAAADPNWELVGSTGALSYVDAETTRGIYYYEVFARDGAGNYGLPAATNDRATNYLLGDVADTPGDGVGNGDYDGLVNITDLNDLAAAYGTIESDVGFYNNEVDVGPTDDHSGTGIPQTDSFIEFEDLMVFALNYDADLLRTPPVAGSPEPHLQWCQLADESWVLTLKAPCAGLKGLRLRAQLTAGSGRPEIVAGAILAEQPAPCFLRNIDGAGLDISLVLLGSGLCLQGAGDLFRVILPDGVASGSPRIEVRGVSNEILSCELDGQASEAVPESYRLRQNRPNPFNPMTEILFELPIAQTVRLEIYGADGRRAAVLLNEPLPAGSHVVTWDGRDSAGATLATGVYVCKLKAGSYANSIKMLLMK